MDQPEYEVEEVGNIWVIWVREQGHRVWSEVGRDFATMEEAVHYAETNQYKERA